MKTINEILNINPRGNYSAERKILAQYQNKPCVIAYYKSSLGFCFIIKGKIEYFAFKGYGYGCWRIGLKEAVNMIENRDSKRMINKKRIERMKNKLLLEELKK